jgi:glycine betaine catabolism B
MLKLKSVNFEQQQFEVHQLEQSYPGQLEWLIGRNTDCDLVLLSPEVSRVHGRIFFVDDHYYFVDIGSTSGSLLNGDIIPVNEKRLIDAGDLLQIGETFLHVEELASPAGTATLPDPIVLPRSQWGKELVCRCDRIIDETPDVKTFCFVAEPLMLFHYKPGQFATVQVEIEGKTVMRPYTISSSPSRPWHISLTVKRVPPPTGLTDVPAGLVSNWMHDHLKVGDRIKLVGGAMGDFTCLPLPPKLLLISAGSGITTMMSMSRWIQDTIAGSDVIFLHSARTPDDIVFRSELETMAAHMANFHLAITLTQPPLMRSWMGLTGRISQSLLYMVAPDLLDRAVYVCGSEGFMQSIRATLEEMHFPMQYYKQESFGGQKPAMPKAKPSALPAAASPLAIAAAAKSNGKINGKVNSLKIIPSPERAPAAAPAVNFANSKCNVSCDSSMSILELAEQEGVPIRSACRVGACGACKVLARQGKVRYDSPPNALTSADQQAGYLLACVAYPVDQLVIEA